MKTHSIIENLNKIDLALIGLILIGGISLIDFITGFEISFSLFYLIPIFFITWLMGKWPGVIASVVCALAWLSNELISDRSYSHPGIYFWNSGVRFGFFIIVTLLLVKLNVALKHEEELARFDYLTGAINSRYFYEFLQRELDRSKRYQRPFTIAYLDLDNFKRINDQFGHQMGDLVLTTIVNCATKKLRSTDLISRFGGDEFVFLFPETDQIKAQQVIRKLQHELVGAMEKNHWSITMSIGVLTCEEASLTSEEVVKMVDDLMYQVKNDGKNAIRSSVYGNSETIDGE